MVIRCYTRPSRCVCIREVQDTIKDSVKQLLEDKIQRLGLSQHFDIQRDAIIGKGRAAGSLIIFKGMQTYNAENIKSLEGFDVAWVEEAQTLSDHSLRLLRPTIRKEGSEIWFSWNPRHDTDAVDKFLRGAEPPRNSTVVSVNWNDNPWFPDVLRQEMEDDYRADPEMAEWVWGGGYQLVSEGAYYARLIAQAEKEGRVGHFPPIPGLAVKTAWDLGIDDYSATWFVQEQPVNGIIYPTVVDYYEAAGDGAEQIISTCMPEVFVPPPWDDSFAGWDRSLALSRINRQVPFKYGESYFPHDIRVREWGGGARSRVEVVQRLGLQNVRKGVATNPEDRISATRALLPIVRFHLTPRVKIGMQRLQRYRRKFNDTLQTYTTPEHDINSHGADAFGEYAINCGLQPVDTTPKPDPVKALLKPMTLNDIMGEHDADE
jgi:phage terminase large subunit